jgi:hypothetical protein
MKSKVTILSLMVLLIFVLLGGPQLAVAQQPTSPDTGTTEPPAPLPNAPSAQAAQNSQPAQSAQRPQSQEGAPLGAAAAQQGATAGGAASKPAGNAIAPAKQRQTRSLLIKLGAIAAGAAAIGAVVALTRSTSPVPPGSGR